MTVRVTRTAKRRPSLRRRFGTAAAGLVLAGNLAGFGATRVPAMHCAADGALPDPICTPGLLNSAVTPASLKQTICHPGYTKQIRPKTSYTDPLKVELMRAYGLTGAPGDYELDHFIPLELGGNPSDPKNLWPEAHAPSPGSPQKDKIETMLKNRVCDGKMTLAEAQQRIRSNWVSTWEELGSP